MKQDHVVDSRRTGRAPATVGCTSGTLRPLAVFNHDDFRGIQELWGHCGVDWRKNQDLCEHGWDDGSGSHPWLTANPSGSRRGGEEVVSLLHEHPRLQGSTWLIHKVLCDDGQGEADSFDSSVTLSVRIFTDMLVSPLVQIMIKYYCRVSHFLPTKKFSTLWG